MAVCTTIHLPRNEAKVTIICNCSPNSDSLTTQLSCYDSLLLSTTTHKAVVYKATGSEATRHTMLKPTQTIRIHNCTPNGCNYDVTEAVIALRVSSWRCSRPGWTAHSCSGHLPPRGKIRSSCRAYILSPSRGWKPPTTCHVPGK